MSVVKSYEEERFEKIKKSTIAQQRAKLETYRALKAEHLPIPRDLKYEIESQGLA